MQVTDCVAVLSCSTLFPMSLIASVLDHDDLVIASDGCAGDPCFEDYVLKTARLNENACVGCVGETDFMRTVLEALGYPGIDGSSDTEIFWDLERRAHPLSLDFVGAWRAISDALNRMLPRLRVHPLGVTVLLVGRVGEASACAAWMPKCDWRVASWTEIRPTWSAEVYIGKHPTSEKGSGVFEGKIARRLGTSGAEARLAEAIRYAAQEDAGRTVNGNVFTRRLSDGFKLRWSLDPTKKRNWRGPAPRDPSVPVDAST